MFTATAIAMFFVKEVSKESISLDGAKFLKYISDGPITQE